MIYLALFRIPMPRQKVHLDAVKIGMTYDVQRRVAQLRSHYGVRASLVVGKPGWRKEELELLERFSHLLIDPAGNRELFLAGPDLLDYIGSFPPCDLSYTWPSAGVPPCGTWGFEVRIYGMYGDTDYRIVGREHEKFRALTIAKRARTALGPQVRIEVWTKGRRSVKDRPDFTKAYNQAVKDYEARQVAAGERLRARKEEDEKKKLSRIAS